MWSSLPKQTPSSQEKTEECTAYQYEKLESLSPMRPTPRQVCESLSREWPLSGVYVRVNRTREVRVLQKQRTCYVDW